MRDRDEAAVSAVTQAILSHLGDICRRMEIPDSGSVEQLKARILRATGHETAASLATLEEAYAAAAKVFGLRPSAATMKTRKGSRTRWALWTAMEAHAYGQSETARCGLFGVHFNRTTVLHGLNRASEIRDAEGEDGPMSRAIIAACQVLTRAGNKTT